MVFIWCYQVSFYKGKKYGRIVVDIFTFIIYFSRKVSMYCIYYQAYVVPSHGWFVVAILKSFDHMLFDRTIDVENSIFEFFVAPRAENVFLEVMENLALQGYISNLIKKDNRLALLDQG